MASKVYSQVHGQKVCAADACAISRRGWCGLLSVAVAAGQELVQALQQVQVQLSASEAQRLAASLRNNAGLLDYKKLTRQLKGHMSHPASAQPAIAVPATAAAAEPAAAGSTGTGDAGVQQHWRRPPSAVPGPRLPADSHSAAVQVCCSNSSSSETGGSSSSRPRSAPSRPSGSSASRGGAGINVSREEYVCARNWRGKNRQGQSVVSHWFCGTRWDPAAAAETATWRPGHAADALTKGWGLNGPAPWDGVPAAEAACCVDAAAGGGAAAAMAGGGQGAWLDDTVPAWMAGADTLHGTCRISVPFEQAAPAGGGAAAARADAGQPQIDRLQPSETGQGGVPHKRPASAGPCRVQAGGRQQLLWGDGSSSLQGSNLQRKPRPMSAASGRGGAGRPAVAAAGLVITRSSCTGVGLAERRRLVQSQQQDLAAVRLLA